MKTSAYEKIVEDRLQVMGIKLSPETKEIVARNFTRDAAGVEARFGFKRISIIAALEGKKKAAIVKLAEKNITKKAVADAFAEVIGLVKNTQTQSETPAIPPASELPSPLAEEAIVESNVIHESLGTPTENSPMVIESSPEPRRGFFGLMGSAK